MMQAFFKTHKYLLEHLNVPVHRGLMDLINWEDRLIGIVGTRGVGKTTFLLDYILTASGSVRAAFCVSRNNLHFSNPSLFSLPDGFQKTGGTTLVLVKVFMYRVGEGVLCWCF